MSTSDFLNSISNSVGNAVGSLGNMMTSDPQTAGSKSRNYKKATRGKKVVKKSGKKVVKKSGKKVAKKSTRGGTIRRLSPIAEESSSVESIRREMATLNKRKRSRSPSRSPSKATKSTKPKNSP